MKYETAVPIGCGGIAEVLRAYDPRLKRDVALKLLRRDDPSLAERMLREAQAQARVEHPHVCPVYETGTTDEGQLYIAMQLIDGSTLDIAAQEMNLEEKIYVLREVAEAVQAAHTAGLIHRDLKPGNILVERLDNGSLKPWVVDFGLARQHDVPGMTITGQVVGTPAYMPPEQARGKLAMVDRRCDVYALGAVLYHLLTGRPPFTGQGTVDVLVKILHSEPVAVRKRAPHVPADLETIAMKCLEKDPARRYPSARALCRDLTAFLEGEPISARPVGLLFRALRKARKHRLVTALLATLLISLPTGFVKYTLDLKDERQRARRAQHEAEDLLDYMLQDLYRRLEPLGQVDLLGEVARKSLHHLEEEGRETLGPATRHRRARAFRNVGLVLEAEGDLEKSLRSFRSFQSIMTELVALDQKNLEWRFDLSESHRFAGEILQDQGHLEEAFASYRTAYEGARALADLEPSSTAWLSAVWHGHANLGWLHLERGELNPAMARFEEALIVVRRLVDRLPQEGLWYYNLSSSLAYLGLTHQERGESEVALERFAEALQVVEDLVEREPRDARWRFEVALNHGRIAYLRQAGGDQEGAETSYRKALAVLAPLAERDPFDAKAQRELAVSHSGLGEVLRMKGDLARAHRHIEASLEISRRLSSQDRSNVSFQNDLAWDLVQLGKIRDAQGEEDAARAAWEEALEIITPVAESTDAPFYRDTQAMALLHLGRLDEARPVVDRLLASGWDDPELLELCRKNGLLAERPGSRPSAPRAPSASDSDRRSAE